MHNLAILALDDFEHYSSTESMSMGGATGVIKSILPYLGADNIYLIGITSDKKNIGKIIPFRNNISIIPLIHVPEGTKIPVRILAFWQSRKINAVLRKFSIDSVYSHAEEISYWIKPGPVVLYHMHGGANAIVKAKNRYLRLGFIRKLWEYVRSTNIRNATRVIAIDYFCFDLAKKQNAADKTMLIPNFVDTAIFYKDNTPSRYLENVFGKVLLFVGRIEEVKGLELFADTVIELGRREPGQWTGVIVGRGTYQPVIEKYIRERSADDLFSFPGPVFRQDELRKIYSRASVLMISSHFEGIPMVILEAIACQTPAMATNVGGIKELIADDIMCCVNDSRNPSEFADIALRLVAGRPDMPAETKFSSRKASAVINSILSGQPV